ncbi:hypothetical protein JTB14_015537 [Gonioctena quinquepunctata]|nr:hypothetical protein JTB14_015537 [Gonioctena quinquepunctata]
MIADKETIINDKEMLIKLLNEKIHNLEQKLTLDEFIPNPRKGKQPVNTTRNKPNTGHERNEAEAKKERTSSEAIKIADSTKPQQKTIYDEDSIGQERIESNHPMSTNMNSQLLHPGKSSTKNHVTKNESITILHVNIQGISNKGDSLSVTLSSLNVDLVCIDEH